MSDRARFIATTTSAVAPLGLVCCSIPYVAPTVLAGPTTLLAPGVGVLVPMFFALTFAGALLLRRDLRTRGSSAADGCWLASHRRPPGWRCVSE